MKCLKYSVLFLTFLLIFKFSAQAQWVQCDGPYRGGAGSFYVSGTTIFANGDEGLFRSTDQAESWSVVKPGLKASISSLVTIGSNIYVLADYKNIYKSEDGGINWKVIDSGLNKVPANCLAVQDSMLFVGTAKGIFSTPNEGVEWSYQTLGVTDSNISAICVSGTNMFAGTVKGAVYFSSDNGNSWTFSSSGLLPSGVRLFEMVGNSLFAVTRTEGIYISSDNGKQWKDASLGVTPNPILSFAVIGNNIFAGTFDGLFVTTNNGSKWSLIKPSITSAPGFFALSVYGNTLYAHGWNGTNNFNKTTDNGKTWSLGYYPGFRTSPYSLMVSDGNIFAGIADGVHLSTDDGVSWQVVNSGIESAVVWAMTTSGSNIFAGAQNNKGVFLSTNNGKSWSAVNNGLGNLNIYELITVGKTIMAGTEDGIFISSDNGANWVPSFSNFNNSLGWVVSIVINGGKIFAATDIGKTFVLSNDGMNWVQVNNTLENFGISCLAVRGSELYACTYKGIYRSTGNGEEWLPDTIGMSGLKIFCLVEKGGSLFAGTDRGVYVSSQVGAAWRPLDKISEIRLEVTDLAVNGNTLFASTQYVSTSTLAEMGVWKYNISALGVEDRDIITSVSTIHCYPNPAANTLTIDRTTLLFPENSPVQYTLSTLIGGKVMEFDNSEQKFTVPLEGMASGVYSLTAVSGGSRAAVMVTVAE